MFDQFLNKAAELLAKGEPFVTASVVRYQAPILASREQGDHLRRRKVWGWIGGGCSQPVVVKEALKALADGQPRLVRISPTASPETWNRRLHHDLPQRRHLGYLHRARPAEAARPDPWPLSYSADTC